MANVAIGNQNFTKVGQVYEGYTPFKIIYNGQTVNNPVSTSNFFENLQSLPTVFTPQEEEESFNLTVTNTLQSYANQPWFNTTDGDWDGYGSYLLYNIEN